MIVCCCGVEQIFEVAMYKSEASAISSAIASVFGQWQGCLACALKSSGVPNGQRQIICVALAMDSDIPKVRMFHVTVSRSYCFIWLHGRGTHGDRKSCKQVLSWKSMKAWVVSGTSLSLEAVQVHLHLWLPCICLFECGVKCW